MRRVTLALLAKTLAFRALDDRGSVLVVVGPVTPTDHDWAQLVQAHRAERHQRALVVTSGAGPTPAQRRAILDVSDGKGLPAAILTDNLMVRGIATALSWFVPEVRTFSPRDLPGALAHLGVTTPIAVVERWIAELKHELANGQPRTR